MAYSIRFVHDRVRQQYEEVRRSVNESTRRSLDRAWRQLEANPFPVQGSGKVKRLRVFGNSPIGSFRIQAGNYRMVYRVEGAIVEIIRVAHRSEVYEGI